MSTFLDVLSDALTQLGELGFGQSVSAEESTQGMRVANDMIQQWSIQKLMLPVINSVPLVLTPYQQDYTLGPTGATFTGQRPLFVENVQIYAPGSAMALPLNLLNKTKWSGIRDKGATCSAQGLPQDIWVEYTYPNLSFHIWTIPSNAATINMAAWEVLQQFATVFDVLNFPPGYEEMLRNCLAVKLAPFYDRPVTADLGQLMTESVMNIQKLNAMTLGAALGETQTLEIPNLAKPIPTGPPQGGPQ